MAIKNDVYVEIDRLREKSINMRGRAIDSSISYEDAVKLREAQDVIFKKWTFLRNMTKAISKFQ